MNQRINQRIPFFRHDLAVSLCTGALHMSLLGLDIGPGDKVITTPMWFIATATAILEAGATPVFGDVEPSTGISTLRESKPRSRRGSKRSCRSISVA